mmetsp:Transcript_14708/g.45970  ORF Transcript_14708/g.45970 Transcript_14708/m.45970 type:complete len:250 (+) Transcript_14708:756-1505(+)
MSTRCHDKAPAGPCQGSRSTARPKSTRPKEGLATSPSTRMLWEFTSRWNAWAEMCSKVGASCASSSRERWQASTKSCCCCARGPASVALALRRLASRKRSSGTPGTRVIASRTRQTSGLTGSVSAPTKSGMRSQGWRLPGSPLPVAGAGLAEEPLDLTWSFSRRLPSNLAFASSCGVRQRISLMATSPRPSSRSAAQTAPKLPVPRGAVTWHLQPPTVSSTPARSGSSLGSEAPRLATATSRLPRLCRR